MEKEEKKSGGPPSPKPLAEDKGLRVKRIVRDHSGAADIPLPMDFVKELGWEPGKTEVLIHLKADSKGRPVSVLVSKFEKP